jgi:putative peptidoglycan lipid II flippase
MPRRDLLKSKRWGPEHNYLRTSLVKATADLPAFRVAAGIATTRLLGLVRVRIFAYYFGVGPWADAFGAALRIPNVIRNLLGEGTLSASFIPVFAGMLENDDKEGARNLAGVVVSLLAVLAALSAFLGILAAPAITTFVAPRFDEHTRALTITLVRIMFPMSGMMILSAWCLGVLNSHRKFFLSYAAPSVWNVAQIGTLVALGSAMVTDDLIVALAWGALGGGVAQFLIQVPSVLRLLGGLRLSLATSTAGVREVMVAWVPVVIGAGVMQLSSIIDIQLGSLVGRDAVGLLVYAQLLAILPVSLFGISVAASQLPEMSRDASADRVSALRKRLIDGQTRIGLFVIPSALLYFSVGGVVVALLYQNGRFGAEDTALVASILAAYAIGLPGQSMVKLLASGHYAVGNTKTPMRISALSLVVSACCAFLLMQRYGAVGIALGSSIGVYVNVSLNLWKLRNSVGTVFNGAVSRAHLRAAMGGVVAMGVALFAEGLLPAVSPLLEGPIVILVFAITYMGAVIAFGHPEAWSILGRLKSE